VNQFFWIHSQLGIVYSQGRRGLMSICWTGLGSNTAYGIQQGQVLQLWIVYILSFQWTRPWRHLWRAKTGLIHVLERPKREEYRVSWRGYERSTFARRHLWRAKTGLIHVLERPKREEYRVSWRGYERSTFARRHLSRCFTSCLQVRYWKIQGHGFWQVIHPGGEFCTLESECLRLRAELPTKSMKFKETPCTESKISQNFIIYDEESSRKGMSWRIGWCASKIARDEKR
jgi:hypothetical protein